MSSGIFCCISFAIDANSYAYALKDQQQETSVPNLVSGDVTWSCQEKDTKRELCL